MKIERKVNKQLVFQRFSEYNTYSQVIQLVSLFPYQNIMGKGAFFQAILNFSFKEIQFNKKRMLPFFLAFKKFRYFPVPAPIITTPVAPTTDITPNEINIVDKLNVVSATGKVDWKIVSKSYFHEISLSGDKKGLFEIVHEFSDFVVLHGSTGIQVAGGAIVYLANKFRVGALH